VTELEDLVANKKEIIIIIINASNPSFFNRQHCEIDDCLEHKREDY